MAVPLRDATDAAVYEDRMRVAAFPIGEPDVSPPKDHKGTDATKLNFPLPLTIMLVGLALTAAAGIWRIESKVSVITTTIEYERELDRQREKYLDQRFSALEAKIETAGLRNAALALSQELAKPKGR